jgi:hypothetical protein
MTVPNERDRVAPSWSELLDAASAVWSASGRTGSGLPRSHYIRLYQAASAHLCHRYAGCFDEDAQAVIVVRTLRAYLAPFFQRHLQEGAGGNPDCIFTVLDEKALDFISERRKSRQPADGPSSIEAVVLLDEDDELVQRVFGPDCSVHSYYQAVSELLARGSRLQFIVIHTYMDEWEVTGKRPKDAEIARKLMLEEFRDRTLDEAEETVCSLVLQFAVLLERDPR